MVRQKPGYSAHRRIGKRRAPFHKGQLVVIAGKVLSVKRVKA